MDYLTTHPLQWFEDHSPRRVVSLVPSWTGSLHDLDLDDVLVGKTDFCPGTKQEVHVIGGPKNPRIEEIILLQPDLVIANQEENGKIAVEELCRAGLPVWLTFPKTVNQMLEDLWQLSALFRNESVMDRVRLLEKNIEWAELALFDQNPVSYFCPIWEDRLETGERWWMTFNQETYSADVLRLVNGRNVFASRERKYPLLAEFGYSETEHPGDRDTRYPRVRVQDIVNAQPELILLPSEPYPYQGKDISAFQAQFKDIPAVQKDRIFLVDGSFLHWPGTILARALVELSPIFAFENS